MSKTNSNEVRMTNSIDATLEERGKNYGEFTTQGMYTQRLKELFRDEDGSWETMDDDMKEALDMIASKIARLINGNPTHIDSWHDIQGYARLVEVRLIAWEEEQRKREDMENGMTASELAAGEWDRKMFPLSPGLDVLIDKLNKDFQRRIEQDIIQPRWEIDPVFHPNPDDIHRYIFGAPTDLTPKVLSASEMGLVKDFPSFHGMHLTGDEVTQGVAMDTEDKGEVVWDDAKDEWVHVQPVSPGFADAFPTADDVSNSSGMEAAHGGYTSWHADNFKI